MGTLSDFVVAPKSAGNEVLKLGSGATSHFPGFQSNKWSSFELSALYSLLANNAETLDGWDDKIEEFEEGAIPQSDEDGPWVYMFPEAFTQVLSGAEEDLWQQAANKWVSIEEFEFTSQEQTHVKQFAEDLRGLAHQAIESDQAIFLWISL
ncbi:MAG: hypothetical protein C4331_09465 [Meiothermus sp.]